MTSTPPRKTISKVLGTRYTKAGASPKLSEKQLAMTALIRREASPADWEDAPCLCGGDEDWVISEVDRYGLEYRKCLCARCGLLRVSPRWTKDRYGRFYEREYRSLYATATLNSPDEYARWVAGQESSKAVGAFVAGACARHLPSVATVNVLEIGAGAGWNLSNMPSIWRRTGFDVDEEYLAAGRRNFGVEMQRGFWEEALQSAGDKDAVLLSHVIEHVADPLETLRTLGAAVKDTAIIILEAPGIFRIHRTSRDPMVYMQSAHTFTFCAATLGAVCESAGLEILEIDEWCHAVLRRKPASAPHPLGRTLPDPSRAGHVLRYLRACEQSERISRRFSFLGAGAVRIVSKFFRAAIHAGVMTGMFGRGK